LGIKAGFVKLKLKIRTGTARTYVPEVCSFGKSDNENSLEIFLASSSSLKGVNKFHGNAEDLMDPLYLFASFYFVFPLPSTKGSVKLTLFDIEVFKLCFLF
jgi:hypothetical protein